MLLLDWRAAGWRRLRDSPEATGLRSPLNPRNKQLGAQVQDQPPELRRVATGTQVPPNPVASSPRVSPRCKDSGHDRPPEEAKGTSV